MKKMIMTAMTILLFSFSWGLEGRREKRYVNLGFTVWKLEKGPSEAACRINTPIPEVFRESWICDFITFDVTDGTSAAKVVEKDGIRFVLTAEYRDRLTIQVFEKKQEILRLVHKRASTVDYIFYGADGLTYLMELTYTAGNHPIGLLSPGILKKQRTVH
jgi:hypothetical protein